MPLKANKNIVIVVCPLNSIIEDQLKVLQERGVTADVLQLATDGWEATQSLFHSEMNSVHNESIDDEIKLTSPSAKHLCKRMNDLCKRMSDLCKRIEWDVTT